MFMCTGCKKLSSVKEAMSVVKSTYFNFCLFVSAAAPPVPTVPPITTIKVHFDHSSGPLNDSSFISKRSTFTQCRERTW